MHVTHTFIPAQNVDKEKLKNRKSDMDTITKKKRLQQMHALPVIELIAIKNLFHGLVFPFLFTPVHKCSDQKLYFCPFYSEV